MVAKTGKKAIEAPKKGEKKQIKELKTKELKTKSISSKKIATIQEDNSVKLASKDKKKSSLENKLDIFQDCEVRNGRIFLKKGNDFANFPDLLSLQKR